MRQNGAVTFLLADHLGSTSVTTDSTGVLVSSMLYTAFGATRSSTGMTASDYLNTGQREESEIGLYFYNARFYDAALARFISADTIVPQPGDPLAWDRYAYVRNNPINGTDPTGHAFCMDGDQFCYDSNNQQWLGNLPSQLTFTFYTSLPTPHTDHNAIFEQSVAELSQVGIFMGRVLVEPVDWGFVAYDCLQGTCNLWDFAGLLPLLPAGITKYGDDAALAIIHLSDEVLENSRTVGHHTIPKQILLMLPEDIKNIVKGKKGAPNIWQIPEPIHKIIHKGAKGGYYNAAWLDAINELKDKSLGKIHPDDIFQIRETLVEIFGLAVWRP